MGVKQPPLYAIPIPQRPSGQTKWLNAILFTTVFVLGCLMVHGLQVVFVLPLRLFSKGLYDEGIRYTKGSFASLMILMCQWFAPTKLVITFEMEGKGKFTQEQVDDIVVRDDHGNVVRLNLPTKSVVISNHQMYADWWYAWCLAYFTGTQKDVFIVLKKSLKWIPVVGWGMQLYDFIFLARSWASDRVELATHLARLGRTAAAKDQPFSFILYPEGTLVSKNTRPISKKFADKMGIDDMTNVLLPRSTGLHYSLRSLAPRIPSLKLIDLTVGYPGIPLAGYGQSYYTLRSIFCQGIPPPSIHIHLRMFDVAAEVPIGDISDTNPDVLPSKAKTEGAVEVEFPESEKAEFDLWLRELWTDKDKDITGFCETGVFNAQGQAGLVIPLRLRKRREFFDAFCFFLPAAIGYGWAKVRRMF